MSNKKIESLTSYVYEEDKERAEKNMLVNMYVNPDLMTNIPKIRLTSLEENQNILFVCGDKEMLRLESSGDIYVKGKLIDNDHEVVDALREYIFNVRKL